jgi:hypothetical protein
MAVSPTQRDTLYVGTTDHPYHDECRAQGIAKSTDGGKTWGRNSQISLRSLCVIPELLIHRA